MSESESEVERKIVARGNSYIRGNPELTEVKTFELNGNTRTFGNFNLTDKLN